MTRFIRFVAVIGVLLLLAACGSEEPDELAVSDDGDEQTEEPDDEQPDGPDDAAETEEPESPESADESDSEPGDAEEVVEGGQSVLVFAIRDVDGYMWVESEERQLDEPTQAVATAAMRELITVAPADPNLFSPTVGTGTEVLGVSLAGGLLTVDVSDDIYNASVGAAGEGMFLQALAHTATQFGTVDSVELLVEGEAITELWGHIEWSEPLTPDPYAQAPIDVARPTFGETRPPGPIAVTGTSLTFEATLELDLIDPNGNVVEETFTTARQPAVDQRGPFEHTFRTPADTPGTWTIRVREPDPSDGEGRPPYVVDIQFQIQ